MTHPLLLELLEFKKQFKEKAQSSLKHEFRAFFDKHPQVGSIVWTQYTPYFNDGDACTFDVHDFDFHGFLEDGSVITEYGCGDGLVSELRAKQRGEWSRTAQAWIGGQPLNEQEKTLFDDAQALYSLCSGLDENMKDIFGDHVKIVASRSGFDVEEYEHD